MLKYLHEEMGVVHGDIGLGNILIDSNLDLKVIDFTNAECNNIQRLKAPRRGTKTYVAPEIREAKVYDGQKVDIFSLGVTLFAIVQGNFPFTEATPNEYYYKLIVDGKYDQYWKEMSENESAS